MSCRLIKNNLNLLTLYEMLKRIPVKNKILKIASLYFLTITLFTSCSKDKKAEKQLEKVKNWQIDHVSYQKASAGFAGFSAKVNTEYNCGTMVFNKDGSGTYDYMLDGQH